VKLGKLNAAIDAAPTVFANTRFGPVALQKGSFKDALKSHFTEGRAQETGLKLDATHVVVVDQEPEA
jgi:hypothetical protein